MSEFPANPRRVDPYSNFRFKVFDDKNCVAAVSRLSGISHNIEPAPFRSGGEVSALQAPGQTSYSPLTLERGITVDASFIEWANKVWDYKNSSLKTDPQTLSDFRKDLTIAVYNEAGQQVLAYKIYKAWVSDITAMPELDGGETTTAIQSLTLQNEGWVRDEAVQPPSEPDYTLPSA